MKLHMHEMLEWPSGRACVRKLLLKKTSPEKLLTGFL